MKFNNIKIGNRLAITFGIITLCHPAARSVIQQL